MRQFVEEWQRQQSHSSAVRHLPRAAFCLLFSMRGVAVRQVWSRPVHVVVAIAVGVLAQGLVFEWHNSLPALNAPLTESVGEAWLAHAGMGATVLMMWAVALVMRRNNSLPTTAGSNTGGDHAG